MSKILVVGGAGGVGLEAVTKLLARGEQVITTVLNDAEAEIMRQAHGEKARIHKIDLSDADVVRKKIADIVHDTPDLSAVLVCAAISINGPVEIAPLTEFRLMLEINCLSNIAIYQAAMPALRANQGRMIMISSVSGKIGLPHVGGYTTSKFALEGVADVMRREAIEQGVHISLVLPGGIRTPMIHNQIEADKKRLAALSEENRSLYGHLYERFAVVAGGSVENSGSTPGEVADILLEALYATDPEPRYPAGADAEQMLGMLRTTSDRDFDGVVNGMFSKSASAGWAENAEVGSS